MKMLKQVFLAAIVGILFVSTIHCGGSGKKLSDTENKLIAHVWKKDVEAVRKEAAANADSASGLNFSEIELKGDVKKGVDWLQAKSIQFGKDEKDPTKLSYKITYGKGLLSTSVVGYWETNEAGTEVIMREWDSQAGKEKEPVTYEIIELTGDKLIIKEKGKEALAREIYVPK